MRISDWSSDVCSSDLRGRRHHAPGRRGQPLDQVGLRLAIGRAVAAQHFVEPDRRLVHRVRLLPAIPRQPGLRLAVDEAPRSEEHTSELPSLMRISYAVFCLKKKTNKSQHTRDT